MIEVIYYKNFLRENSEPYFIKYNTKRFAHRHVYTMPEFLFRINGEMFVEENEDFVEAVNKNTMWERLKC